MRKNVPVVLALAAALTATACSRSSDNRPVASETPSGGSTAPPASTAGEQAQALVRVVNAIPGAPSVSVTADERQFAANVPYAGVTPYQQVPASADDFTIRLGGESQGVTVAANSEGIRSGGHYTLVAFPGKDSDRAGLEVFTDDIETPDAGKARVRVIHAAADAETLDVYGTEKDAMFDGVDFRESTSYKTVDPTMTKLELRADGGKRVMARPTVSIEAGRSYTIVVAGRAHGSPSLRAVVIEDRIVGDRPTE
jgi:hypothetical protein